MATKMYTIKRIKRKINTVFGNPKVILTKALFSLSPLLSDKVYLKLLFPLKAGYKLDLKHPQTYNEKLQWLKLYYRDPLLPKLVDKYEYKQYVKERIGEEYVVKNYGVWDTFEEIDFDSLPDQFVLKTTHDQGGVVICKDKPQFDLEIAKKRLNKHLKGNLFYLMREWPYKHIKPRIIAEEFLVDESGIELKDYKFYCFDGKPVFMYIAHGRQNKEHYFDFYDMEFNHLDIDRQGYKQSKVHFAKPQNWNLMIHFAREMSSGQPHARIDFYNINGRILFGEYTLFQGGGMMPFYPPKWDYEFGRYLQLPDKKITS